MANIKVSQLPAASTPLTGTELAMVVQGGVSKQVTASNFTAATLSSLGVVVLTGTGATDQTTELTAALSSAASGGKQLYIPVSSTIQISGNVSIPDGVIVYGGGTIQSGTTTSPSHSFLFIGDSSKVTGVTLNNISVLSYYNKNNWEVSDNTFGAVLSTDPIVNQNNLSHDIYKFYGGTFEAVRVTNYSAGTYNGNATYQPTGPTGFKVSNNKSGSGESSTWPLSMCTVYAGTYADIVDNTFFARTKLTDALITNTGGATTANDPTIQFAGLTLTTNSMLNMNKSAVYTNSEQPIGILWSPTWQQVKSTANAWVGLVLIGANRNYYRVTGKVTNLGTLTSGNITSTSSLGGITVTNASSVSVSSTGYILIDNEQFAYSAVSGTTTLTITLSIRGMNFTNATTHNNGAAVYFVELGSVSAALGATEPTHTSGTAINGTLSVGSSGVLLTYDGVCSATAPYTYKLNDICAANSTGGVSQYSSYGALVSYTTSEMVQGRTYRIMALGSTTQAQWNTFGGTSGKNYCVGSVFTAALASTPNYDFASAVIPAFLYGSAANININPGNSGVSITGGSYLTVTDNTYYGGKVCVGVDSTPIYSQYQFPLTDNKIERNTVGYSSEETIAFDAIAGNGAPFLTSTIATTTNGYASSSVTLADNADPVGNVTPVGRILKFLTGSLAGKSFKVTAVSGISVTLGDDWGTFWSTNPYVATSGDIVTIEYDVRRNSIINNTVVDGTITIFGIGSDMTIADNKMKLVNWNSYPNNAPYSYNTTGISVTSMLTYGAPKNSTLLGGSYAYLAPANLIIKDNVCEGQNGVIFGVKNEVNTNNVADLCNVTLTGNIGGACVLGPIKNLIDNGNNFTSYTVLMNPRGVGFPSSVQITGTAGQFSCAATTLVVGQAFVISGTNTGTGSITGYLNPTTYYIIATNGTTTFTLSATKGGSAITTTAGTPVGLSYLRMDVSSQTYGSEHAVFTKNAIVKSGSPVANGVKPSAVQQPYIDYTNSVFYIAKGTNYGDFVQIN